MRSDFGCGSDFMTFGRTNRELSVVGGSGRARLDQDLVELDVWVVLRVGDGVRRAFEAGPDGLQMLCLGGGDSAEIARRRA